MNRCVTFGGVLTLTLTALLLAGCEEGHYSYYTPTPCPPALSAPLDATAQAIALNQYATRSAVEVEAAAAQMNATVQAVIAQATADAARAVLEQQRQAATAEAARATQQAQATTDAFNLSQTATAQSVAATATERAYQAQATATEIARQATATAQYRADAATATAQVWAFQETATAQSIRATQAAYQATQQAYQVTATRQAQRREEVLAYGRDYGIPAVLLIGLAGLVGGLVWLLAYAVRQHARRPVVIRRNLLGDADPLAVPMPGGGWNVLDLDRQPGHVTRLLPDGTVESPQFRSAGQEERTTARDQMVDGATRPRLGPGAGASRAISEMPLAPPPTPPAPGLRRIAVLRRLDQAALAGVLPPTLVASLEQDWEEVEE